MQNLRHLATLRNKKPTPSHYFTQLQIVKSLPMLLPLEVAVMQMVDQSIPLPLLFHFHPHLFHQKFMFNNINHTIKCYDDNLFKISHYHPSLQLHLLLEEDLNDQHNNLSNYNTIRALDKRRTSRC